MRFSTICKVAAAIFVMLLMSFAGLLYYHLKVKPLRGVFDRFFPTEVVLGHKESKKLLAKVDPLVVPEIDPSAKVLQKADEEIGRGNIGEARTIWTRMVKEFPDTKSTLKAREYLSSMNLRDLFDPHNPLGKQEYLVPRGSGYLALAQKNQTSLANLMALNGMSELRGPQPGQRLLVMPLAFRTVIDRKRSMIVLEKEQQFFCQYPILEESDFSKLVAGETSYDARTGFVDGLAPKRVAKVPVAKPTPPAGGEVGKNPEESKTVAKMIRIKQGLYQIRALPAQKGMVKMPHTLYLAEADLEELNLLTRNGNEIVILPANETPSK